MSHGPRLWHERTSANTATVGGMEQEWYYCLEHATVEPEFGCRLATRLGPYPTRQEAARALETVEERNEAWEADPDWNDDKEA